MNINIFALHIAAIEIAQHDHRAFSIFSAKFGHQTFNMEGGL